MTVLTRLAAAILGVSIALFTAGHGSLAQAKESAKLDIGTARDIWDGPLYPDKAVRPTATRTRSFPPGSSRPAKSPCPCP